jgi:hypothetical protein
MGARSAGNPHAAWCVPSYDEAGIVRKRILGGEAFDVTFFPAGWDEVRKALASDPVAIAHSDLGMAVLSHCAEARYQYE